MPGNLQGLNLEQVLDSTSNGVVVIDRSGVFLFYNQAAGRLLGRDPLRMLGRHAAEISPDTWPDLQRVLETGDPQIGRQISINGATIVANRSPILDGGRVAGVVSVFQDISEYEKVLTELDSYERLNRQLDAIIETSFDGLWICDSQGRVIRVNQASQRLNRIQAAEVVGQPMESVVEAGIVDRSVSLEVLKRSEAVTMKQRLPHGQEILVTGSPVLEEDGAVSMVVVNERDITELNRLQRELEETRALSSAYRSEIESLYRERDFLRRVVIRSEAMQRVLSTAMKVAEVDSTVMIRGESGVGKGLFARLIHQASRGQGGDFIRVDCGAIPEALIESELFGYEKGAFTGARTHGKPGHFELAEGGTLFLDEVGELPLGVQVKVLRFLEENEVMRVGGTQPRHIDTRVIAATHRNLEEMVSQGSFRKDLFFRLNVVPITIPPLRRRTEDIPSLIRFFLGEFNRKCRTNKVISPAAVDCMCSYGFPGNVRELANLMERLVVLTPGERIDTPDLPARVQAPPESRPQGEDGWRLSQAVAEVERRLIQEALAACGTQRRAAARLGVNQSTLARKARRYGIKAMQ
jgi:PAS domain S-box-containing protein